MGRPKGGGGDALAKLREAAGRGFRTGGYGGIGVDGLAKEAGLTSGAFYAHFGSKAGAFALAVGDGLDFLHRGIEAFQEAHGRDWAGPFIDFYLGERMQVSLDEACVLPTLSADVIRADAETKLIYRDKLAAIAVTISEGLSGEDRDRRAWQILSILTGAAIMARALDDPVLADTILNAAKGQARAVALSGE